MVLFALLLRLEIGVENLFHVRDGAVGELRGCCQRQLMSSSRLHSLTAVAVSVGGLSIILISYGYFLFSMKLTGSLMSVSALVLELRVLQDGWALFNTLLF